LEQEVAYEVLLRYAAGLGLDSESFAEFSGKPEVHLASSVPVNLGVVWVCEPRLDGFEHEKPFPDRCPGFLNRLLQTPEFSFA